MKNMNKFAKASIVLLSSTLLAGCSMASLPKSLTETRRNIKAMKENGILVDLTMSDFELEESGSTASGAVTFGQKGDTMWAYFDGEQDGETVKEGVAIAKSETGAYLSFTLNLETNEYDFDAVVEDNSQIEEINQIVDIAFTYAHTVSALLSNAGTEEYLGRECSVYNFAYNNFLNMVGADADVTIYVDNETGVTLKAEHSIYAAGEETGLSFAVTRFVTENVTLPEINFPVEIA